MFKSKNKEKQTAKQYSFKRKRQIGMIYVTRSLNNCLLALRIRIYENTL